ncbi:MAG: hypothetical protein Q8P41_30230 [Pseudomonadota bacterium]|jgi:hypothetical protein|nr:hypothetical protein [Pseudomonadota bacterium]
MLFAFLLAGCTGSSVLGAQTLDQLDTVQALLDAHTEAVSAATSMDDVTTLEADHSTAMGVAMEDMGGMMSDMMACDMGSMMDSMADADSHMQEMMSVPGAHAGAHSEHGTMDDCRVEEDDYSVRMGDHLDAMKADMMGFDAEASCSSGGGMM